MTHAIGIYLDDYTRLDQPGASAELHDLARTYPWFTLGRYLHLRSLRNVDPEGYNRVARQIDVRLFVHPYPRVLLTDDENGAMLPAFLPPATATMEQTSYATPPMDTIGMIDDFLNREAPTRITPPPVPGDGYWQEDISTESVTDDGEIATEILAEIYLAQGLPDRAVEIYYKLSLKYPEKSAYFADLITGIQSEAGHL